MRKLKNVLIALVGLVVLASPTAIMAKPVSASHSGNNGSLSNATVICFWNEGTAHRFFTAWDTRVVNGGCYFRSNANPSNTWMLVAAVTGHDWTGAEIYRSFPDTFNNNDWVDTVSEMNGNIPNLAKIKLWVAMCPKPPYAGPCLFPALAAEA